MPDNLINDESLPSRDDYLTFTSEEGDILDLVEDDFQPPAPISPPGPGLPESLLWIFGFFTVQIIASLPVLIVLFVMEIVGGNGIDPQNLQQADIEVIQKRIMNERMADLIGWTQAITAVIVFVAVVIRLGGKKSLQRLPLSRMHVGQLAQLGLIGLIFFTVIVFTGQWSTLVTQFWEDFVLVHLPQLQQMEKESSMELFKKLVPTTPLWSLLFMLAVAPAVTEELVFRGVIGRGLTARWGVVAGVIMTSILFAAVHISPPHVLALLPLAVVLHLSHLSTRTILVPMLIHFCFNSLSVVMGKLATADDIHAFDKVEIPPFSPTLFIGSGICLITLCWLLWAHRYRFKTPDNIELLKGYFVVDVPEDHVQARGNFGELQIAPIIASGLGVMIFLGTMLYTGFEKLAQ